eukprot:Blabericola_migrator_1__4139@NODE_2263_length_3038_cov_254_795692_g1304_i1_p2_GENE_NODE_2263_length_3038_cov_254_795692_g1304_i1NODE_2263_length_3038_cov_254_795692_g1304_i1_p2_ORF_typecomplete_len249_score29_74NT5C/PF06941_12/1_6e29HAD_2/PF13419_6/2_1e05NIF/PF03031_18/0_0007NIF/PF03031_18/1_1e04Acid_phosphat_B/PF03767_14/0_0063_NODE_2263_length_3038_cov_254_795692_g1304_i120112757
MINSFETQTTALPVFALDIDEVLADTLTQCNAWHNEVFGTSYTIDDYKSYRFCETWGCTDDEAMTRFLAFTKSPYWDRIEPIPGSQEFVRQMQLYYRLAIVTSRQNYLKDSTHAWLDKHFGIGSFYFIGFGNQWLAEKNAIKISKYEMCKQLNAIALVDDLPRHIMDVLPVVKCAILFNFHGDHNWSVIPDVVLATHPTIKVCRDWTEVARIALALRPKVPQLATEASEKSLERVLVAEGGGGGEVRV